jgi:hypothetical protein
MIIKLKQIKYVRNKYHEYSCKAERIQEAILEGGSECFTQRQLDNMEIEKRRLSVMADAFKTRLKLLEQ